MRKGQSNLIAVVLLTLIVLILINIAYFWGTPLLEKSKDKATLDMMKENFRVLNEKIISVAHGGGQEQHTLNFDSGFLEIVNDTTKLRVANDTINFSFYSLVYSLKGKNFILESDNWIDLYGNSIINCCTNADCSEINSDNCTIEAGGPNENPGVIAGLTKATNTKFFQNYILLKYKEIDKNTGEGTIIGINPSGNPTTGPGKHTILIKNAGTQTEVGKSNIIGSNLNIIKVEITFI